MILRRKSRSTPHVPAIEVQVVSLDWKGCSSIPKQGVASVNQLVVPVGTPVRFRLTSASVMNSFFVPQLAGQIYTMSGMTTQLNLLADHPGQYQGLSSQFSGDGFSGMRFTLEGRAGCPFEAWIGKARASGGTLDAAGYAALARPSKYVPPATYAAVDPGLFERIRRPSVGCLLLPLSPAPHCLAHVPATATAAKVIERCSAD